MHSSFRTRQAFAAPDEPPTPETSEVGPWASPLPTNKTLKHYLIIAEDLAGGQGLARRLSVREKHLHQALLGKVAGRVELGGGLLGVDHAELQPGKSVAESLVGSALVVLGESVEDVRSRFAQDVYSTAGVFDPEKIKIFPFLKAALPEQAQGAAKVAPAEAVPPPARPSLGQLREQEQAKWNERAAKSLAWLRENASKQQHSLA